MRNLFISVDEAARLINDGIPLLVAGSEAALSALPAGCWVGGTTPYFVAPEGALIDKTRVFCTVLDSAIDTRTTIVGPDELNLLTADRFEHGFTFIVVPAFSAVHRQFALHGPQVPELYMQPTFGWVSGIDLADLGRSAPKVFDGTRGAVHDEAAIVMHVALPADHCAEADIVNLFSAGDGDEITFDTTAFSATTCRVNGQEVNFADYVRSRGIDTRLPLVSDYAGAMINVSFQNVGDDRVDFYAPVVAGMTYRLAKPVTDYVAAYAAACDGTAGQDQWSCNCILNYLYADLPGKRTGSFVGPVTFGEIAYILLNQTLVHVAVTSMASAGQPVLA